MSTDPVVPDGSATKMHKTRSPKHPAGVAPGGLESPGRRRFLKTAGRTVMATAMWPVLTRCGETEPAPGASPVAPSPFRFAVISDTHIVPDTDALQNEVFSQTVGVLNAHDPALDLVVITGDVVDRLPSDDPDYYRRHDDTALDRLLVLQEALEIPLHLVLGNHDYYTDAGPIHIPLPTTRKAEREQLFMDKVGMPGPYYAIRHKGFKLCCLNSMQDDPEAGWKPNSVGSLGPEQIGWLRRELADGLPAFFFHHHALATEVTTTHGISSLIPFEIPCADGNFRKYRNSPQRDYTDPIYDVLQEHREQVRACFFGHSHLFLHDTYAGVPLFMTNCMKFPCLSQHDGRPMRYHIVECDPATGAFTIFNAHMIPYVNDL